MDHRSKESKVSTTETPIHHYLSSGEVIAGPGAAGRAGEMLTTWGVRAGQTVALVVDADVSALGLADAIRTSLEAAGFAIAELTCDRGEPQLAGAERIVDELRRAAPAACVGVGGGSTMDIAKLAAALLRNSGPVTDYLGAGKVRNYSIPTIMVPTTSGTGSETTVVSMMSTGGRKVVVASAALMPRGAILDPELTRKLPRRITAASGLDALSHGLESYISLRANPMTMGASLNGARRIASSILGAADTPDDLDHRMDMLAGAYWSGLGLNANVVIGHSIAYTIANRTGLPHGVTCAVALPYCLAFNHSASAARMNQLAATLHDQVEQWAGSPTDPTGIFGWLAHVTKQLEIPAGLKDVGIERADIDDMVTECVESYPRPNNPVPLERDQVAKLYEFMYQGDVQGCLDAFDRH
jgi:alcohol dehydrogenase class IV